MANYDYGMDRQRKERVRWQGIALYGKISPVSNLRVSPRLEWFDDPQGFITGTRQSLKEATLTVDFVFNENMFLRGEYRRDWSNQPLFQHLENGAMSFQNTLTVGVVYTYSKTK